MTKQLFIRKWVPGFLGTFLLVLSFVWYSGGCGGGGGGSGGGGVETTPVTVTGRVLFDDGTPVPEATVTGNLATSASISAVRSLKQAFYKSLSTKSSNPGITRNISLQKLATKQATTASDGTFSIDVGEAALPIRVLVEVNYAPASYPGVASAKWGDASSGTLDLGDITIPNPADPANTLTVTNGSATSASGALLVAGLGAEVSQLFGRVYDPSQAEDAFPGEFAELADIPLNSAVFVWMEALDADGNAVNILSQPATIRSLIPTTQWADLEDITSGTDRIEIPIYTYNEETDMWEQENTGWLEDGNGTVLPEDAESVVLDGTFGDDIYATYLATHLSWMNVDYPYIGPWTLSRIDIAKRNTDCLANAMRLAQAIANSATGRAAYAKVNVAGADLAVELADGAGPELKNTAAVGEYGSYAGDASGSETQFSMSDSMWDGCAEGSTASQKKDATLVMAVTILHETAHWKDDVKKYPGDDSDTAGEEGNQLEEDIFGGIVTDSGGIKLDGNAVADATRDQWLDTANWPAAPSISPLQPLWRSAADSVAGLSVTIALSKTTFEMGEEIPVQVTYQNISSSAIRVMNRVVLEGWPLYFDIINQATDVRVSYIGSERKLVVTDSDFTTLQPDETLTVSANLLRDSSGNPLYQFASSGGYTITAVYEELFGVQEATSNELSFTVNPGGIISGTVLNATDAQAISGASVRVSQNGNLLTTATTGTNGSYTSSELPSGTYTIEVRASGHLRATEEDVAVTGGQTTSVNFSLSSLLAAGELRVVLTWGENPRDLDTHLWLPTDKQYHLYYGRTGDDEACPFAELDVDDTDSYGPETLTIRQRLGSGTYIYAVNYFAGDGGLTTSEAQVQIFDSSGLIATFNVPTTGTGSWWNVFMINATTREITEAGTIGDAPTPYTDTQDGCAADD